MSAKRTRHRGRPRPRHQPITVTLDTLDAALDAAVDALARRARVLDGCDADVAHAVREIALRLDRWALREHRNVD